jgi:hypothetical protein
VQATSESSGAGVAIVDGVDNAASEANLNGRADIEQKERCYQQSHSPHRPTPAIDLMDLPIPTCFAISSLTRIAPMGNPFASGFAIVTISGL